LDSRHLVLGGSLLSAALFGFPVFCLVCPIGLIFGTVIVAWQFIGFEDLSLSLLIYPLLLIVELVFLRKWCARFCPLGAALSLMSLPNRLVKPVVNREKCISCTGGSCHVCADVCEERLDPHCATSMNECTKCGVCKDRCPAGAISFALLPKKDAYLSTTE
jgi:ferredoxin-type protein NapH